MAPLPLASRPGIDVRKMKPGKIAKKK